MPRHVTERGRLAALVSACLLLAPTAMRADIYPRQPGVDAVHYVFQLTLSDATDEIVAESVATVRFTAAGVKELALDLVSAADSGGMTVDAVRSGDAAVAFAHDGNRLRLLLPDAPRAGEERAFTIVYRGEPAGGLRVIPNIHGERTFFSENWPDNARHWLPLVDHPSDKATGEFIVTAPAHYQVVANGLLVEEIDLPDGTRRTHWKQSVPIASWLYALGVARFTARHYAVSKGIAHQTWVFPQDRDRGREVFDRLGRASFDYFSEQIGPYAYEKLAHVQAAGLRGGTEHATVIFYGEQGVADGRAPVVHEVAHQWWGNAVTERDWDDVWLSEGFATYFTLLFTEHAEGRDAFVAGLQRSRATILEVEEKMPGTPIVHQNLSDMRRVLNALVYQKGGWTLHMLRRLVGTDTFWTGIRDYYGRYMNGNASTDDFRRVMERASGRDLGWFFAQWLTRSGVPRLEGSWSYDAAGRQIVVELAQVQPGEPYRLPIEVGIATAGDSAMRVERAELTGASGRFTVPADAPPADVVLDPHTWLLMAPPAFGKR